MGEQDSDVRNALKPDRSLDDLGLMKLCGLDDNCASKSASHSPVKILMVSDQFELLNDGISGTNKLLIFALTGFAGVTMSCTVFQPSNQISDRLKALSDKLRVKLISLSDDICSIAPNEDPNRLYTEVNTSPEHFANRFVLDGVQSGFQSYTHIIGHSPITCKLAVYSHEKLFCNAKLILFFHVIPRDQEWLKSDGYSATLTDEGTH